VTEERGPRIVQVAPASEDEVFLVEWGREQFKSSVTVANDVLKQVITICSVLLTAAVGFLDRTGVARPWQVLVFALLLAPLVLAFHALVPAEATVDVRDPDALRAFRESILRQKRRALRWVTWLLVGAFACAMLGVITRARG
jgi:magnesium-transporting ATPase (P-type)